MKYLKEKITMAGYNLIIFGFVSLCIELGILGWSNPSIRQTILLATTVQPETFTELYFDNHTTLPATTVPNKSYSFAFTIRNLENKDMTYPYQVVLRKNGATQ